MNIISLFDGISCGIIAAQRAGLKVENYFAAEIDKFAIQVSQRNHPQIIQLGDVRQVRASDLPQIDLLIGGSPCQGFSYAGGRLNFQDPRSKLFFEYVRILKECKPKHFLLENVKMDTKSENTISSILGVKPLKINSNRVSAQNRGRLYWTNIAAKKDLFGNLIPGIPQPTKKHIYLGDILEDSPSPIFYKSEKWIKYANKKNGFSFNPINIKAALYKKGQCLMATYFKGGKMSGPYIQDKKGIRAITPVEAERLQTVPDNYTAGLSNTQRYKTLGNGWTVDVIAHIFSYI